MKAADNESVVRSEEQHNDVAVTLRQEVDSLDVTDRQSFLAVQAVGLTAKEAAKAMENHMRPQISDANAKHKKLTRKLRELNAPLLDVAKDAKAKCIAWSEKQDGDDKPKVEGARKVWKAEIVDMVAMFKAFGDDPKLIPYKPTLDLAKLATALQLGDWARSNKERAAIPGVKFEQVVQ